MSAGATILVAILAAVGAVTVVWGVGGAVQKAFRPRRDWEFGNPAPCERVERPKPTPPPPRARPAGPFGTQTFPIYPRPGDPDYRTKVEPTNPWPPPPRRDSGVAVKGTIRRVKGGIQVETSPGIPLCRCPAPSLDLACRARGMLLDYCAKCGLPISLWRPTPEAAFVDGSPGWARSAAWTEAEQAAGWGE